MTSASICELDSQSGASPSEICKFHQKSHSDAPYKNENPSNLVYNN